MNLKQRLNNNEIANGIMLSELYTPNIIRILANCEYDFVLIDCEHGYFDLSQVANLIAVADGAYMPVWIRVAQNSQSNITKYLDMGAHGILLSNVTTIDQVRELINLTLYAPLGDRGVSTFRAHTNYQHEDIRKVMDAANAKNVVIAQIESPEAVTQIKRIVSLEGLDGILIGPNDLTQHMSMIGNYKCREIEDMLKSIAQATKEYHKWSGIITADEYLIRKCHSLGMQCFSSSSELNALEQGALINIEKMRRIHSGI